MAAKSNMGDGVTGPVTHSHSHQHKVSLSPADRRRVIVMLAAVVVPLALATILGLWWWWPHGQSPIGQQPEFARGATQAIGEVTFIGNTDQNQQTPVKMLVDGAQVGVHVPYETIHNGLHVGDQIKAIFSPDLLGTDAPYIFVDFVRAIPLWILLGLYVLVVAAVARIKGIAALAGLGLSLAVVGFFMLPALMAGYNAVAVVIVGAAAMMFASIYLAHGVSIRTTTAVIGTFGGLVITGIIAGISISGLHLTGVNTEESIALYSQLGNLKMNQILLCGIILAGLGALNDVTITQVSTVWELHAANPAASRRTIFRQAMVVGRDHIASTVYTLAFAYVGSALPLLMSAALIDRTVIDFLLIGQIAEEIVRTLVASIGLVLAIPMTTAIACTFAPVAPARKIEK